MQNLFNDETMEVEELFASDKSSMKARHIAFAKRDYGKLKQLGYVEKPSDLKLNEYLWVDVRYYIKPRTKIIEIADNLEIRVLQHPNGTWTYGLSVFLGARGWSFLPGIFTSLCRTEHEACDTALNCMIEFLQEDKKSGKWVKMLKGRLSGNTQLDLFAGFAF